MKSHAYAGRFNLKGKKYKLLSCKCCVVQDFRYRERIKEAKKEMNYEKSISSHSIGVS
jgi:hypothetical protein